MKHHLDLALERNAFIASFGDFFDAMEGKYDPRKSYDNLRSEYKTDIYLDAIVNDGAKFLEPYKNNIIMMGMGNHERQILKRQGTNLIERMLTLLEIPNALGGVGGWIKLYFNITKTEMRGLSLYYHHGAGGGGPVTRGTIQSNRQAVYLPDANIIVNGHTHDEWYLPIARHRLSKKGFTYKDYQHHVRVAGYREDFGDGADGWWIDRWGPPKPAGAVWIRFSIESSNIVPEFRLALG